MQDDHSIRQSLLPRLREPLGSCIWAAVFILVWDGCCQAAIFRCVDANGNNTYSDRPCSPPPSTEPAAAPDVHRTAGAAAPGIAPGDRSREAKATQILQSLQLAWAAGSESARARRTVDLVAPDLVKQLDPANPSWTPQHPRWQPVLAFVKSDLARDAMAGLRASSLKTNQAVAHEYALRAQDADMDALLRYINSPEGSRYIAFQSELNSISNQAYDSLMAQEPVASEEPGDLVLKRRQQMLSLGYDARIAIDGGGAKEGPTSPGSQAILDITARREATALDTLYGEYEPYLQGFTAFTESALAKRFFAAVEPAVRTNRALSSVSAGEFADAELANYEPRWRAFYGPSVRPNGRVTTIVRNGSSGMITTRNVVYDDGAAARESAALRCEQRENANYARVHRSTADPDAQAALRVIQNTCRAEQGLPPF